MPTDRRSPRRVFLSHTSELRQLPERTSFVAAAEAAVSQAGDAVSNMAYWSARTESAAEVSEEAVANAEIYVGIIGFKFGSRVPDRPGVSYTELEHLAAVKHGLPRLIFLLDRGTHGPAELFLDLENGARQEDFRNRLLASGATVRMVTSPIELQLSLAMALMTMPSRGRLVVDVDLDRESTRGLRIVHRRAAELDEQARNAEAEGLTAKSHELTKEAIRSVGQFDPVAAVRLSVDASFSQVTVALMTSFNETLEDTNKMLNAHRVNFMMLMDPQFERIERFKHEPEYYQSLTNELIEQIDRYFDEVKQVLDSLAHRFNAVADAVTGQDWRRMSEG